MDRRGFVGVARCLSFTSLAILVGYGMMEARSRVLYEGYGELAIEELRGITYYRRGRSYFYLYLYQGECVSDRLITIGIDIMYYADRQVGFGDAAFGGGELGYLGAGAIGY